MLKNISEKIETKILATKRRKLLLHEELKAAGMTEQDLEIKEHLKQFLPDTMHCCH